MKCNESPYDDMKYTCESGDLSFLEVQVPSVVPNPVTNEKSPQACTLTNIRRFSALFDFDWLRQYLILFAGIQK